ncbi:(2Fe-2S)-binding protein [Jiangella anatolica]|uniref:Iron-sulfur protein n=1 Tax=Jiangella anatolica TaxID=2670374 RepID=A0A2W2BCS8_9ACTN|nr:(2Fe-2S)-binding protein [Jiangella anatolica]PZF83822.1 iron-sulfur protein [Jiangella anatolica]
MTDYAGAHPLARTLGRASRAHDWLGLTLSPGRVPDGFVRTSDVDESYVTTWEAAAVAGQVTEYGRSHPLTTSGYVLGWYADVVSVTAARCFFVDRRVPRLGRESLAFRCHPEHPYPDDVAVLDPRFWCLPCDDAAAHPDATVVDDEAALAAVLRAEVRAHADAFLATFRTGARLPRRHLLGAFFDGIDSGFWLHTSALAATEEQVVATARTTLPGGADHFADPSSYYTVVDDRGRSHLTRRRISCCFYYKVADDGLPCTTCPRTSDADRAAQLSRFADEERHD